MSIAGGGSTRDLAGIRLGRYQVQQRIGQGGMGTVYRATDTVLHRTVAIKVPHGPHAADPGARRALLAEARAACRVQHPNVATVLDVIEDRDLDQLFLVMEYIDGRPMSDLLAHGPRPPAEIARLGAEIADALGAIHGAGLVHRDLKPGNVLITADGRAKVTDFGIALALRSSADSETVTAEVGHAGTVLYSSPEQLSGKPIDERSDLFSLGVMLYEGIAGKHPFDRGDKFASAIAIINDPPSGGETPLALTETGTLYDIVTTLLEKDPARRYSRAAQVERELRTALGDQKLSKQAGRLRLLLRRDARLRIAAGLMGAALLVAAAGGGWFIARRPAVPKGPRQLVAVLPFADRTGTADGVLRGEMVADLLAADLAESRYLRALGAERVRDLVGLPTGESAGQPVRAALELAGAAVVVTGTLYRDGGQDIAAIEVHRAAGGDPQRFRVAATGPVALVDEAGREVRVLLAARSDNDPGADRYTSPSDEARLAFARAKKAAATLKYSAAIEDLGKALSADPGFVPALNLLAQTLERAGYVKRARTVADRALAIAAAGGLPERLALETRATQAKVQGHAAAALEFRRAIVERAPDDVDALIELADARRARRDAQGSLETAERALAIDRVLPRALLLKSRALRALGRGEDADRTLGEAESQFRQLNSTLGLAMVTRLRALAAYGRGDYAGAAALFRDSADAHRAAGLETQAALDDKNGADAEQMGGRAVNAIAKYTAAVATARATGANELAVDALSSLGALRWMGGDLAGAERDLVEAIRLARTLENDEILGPPLANFANLVATQGRYEEARSAAAEAAEIAQSLGDLETAAVSGAMVADADFQAGRIADAVRGYAALIDRDRKTPSGRRGALLCQAAEVLIAAGDLGGAERSADEAVTTIERDGPPHDLPAALLWRARARAELGALESSEADLRLMEEVLAAGGQVRANMAASVAVQRAELAVLRGDDAGAEVRLAGLRRKLPTADEIVLSVRTLLASCAAANGTGRFAAALDHARSVLDLPRALPTDKNRARLELARALRGSGREAEAADAARRALRDATAMGQPLVVARAAAFLSAASKQPPDASDVAVAGRAAWKEVLSSISPERRETLRARRDLKLVDAQFGKGAP